MLSLFCCIDYFLSNNYTTKMVVFISPNIGDKFCYRIKSSIESSKIHFGGALIDYGIK